MHDIRQHYRHEDGKGLIEIELRNLHQLFNTFDPSPFHDKDLDADAEEYIVGAVREFARTEPLKLVFYLPPDQLPLANEVNLRQSIHNYFDYRLHAATRDLRFQLRQGRAALLIGLGFLLACSFLREAITLWAGNATLVRTLTEGLLIAGWVAMWRPINVFLYEWWPLRRLCNVFAKLAAIDVDVRPSAALTRPASAQPAA